MNLTKRIELLAKLGQNLIKNLENYNSVLIKAKVKNPWFTIENQENAIKSIAQNYLNAENLNKWVELYGSNNFVLKSKKIGVICAGNIPLVGIHDLISVFISGNIALVKLSSKDEILMKFIIEKLYEIDEAIKNYIQIVPKLANFDAVIATGSNNSARYFEYYFRNVPLLLRKNRTSIAILQGNETDEELKLLANDIFDYFGLGCRNVSKVYVPKDYNLTKIFDVFAFKMELRNHHKYQNNFEYNLALYLMNQEPHLANEFFIMREDKALFSRLAVVHYEFYNTENELNEILEEEKDNIQCKVGKHENCIPFGTAQKPNLWDYADGVDTLEFLFGV